MCKKHTEENEIEENSSKNDSEDGMTREELHRKVREHMERRSEAYRKMSTVDEPRE